MSYLCDICNHPSQRGKPKLRHTLYRNLVNGGGVVRQEISKELAVCEACGGELSRGTPLENLIQQLGSQLRLPAPVLVEPPRADYRAQPPAQAGRVVSRSNNGPNHRNGNDLR